jgi:hypothetical protein
VSLPRQKAITQTFGWGYARVSLNTKKIKGLHENDFILASKIDRLLDRPDGFLDHVRRLVVGAAMCSAFRESGPGQ